MSRQRLVFPDLIHVLWEEPGSDEPFLIVSDDGVSNTSIEETRRCAIYKRVSVGEVEVSRRFVEKKR